MYCYRHGIYYTGGHCHQCCHCCHHHCAPSPQYWCSVCQRYTHTVHNHWVQPMWPPPVVRPVIICGPVQRNNAAITALAG